MCAQPRTKPTPLLAGRPDHPAPADLPALRKQGRCVG